ncbi:hypothetical protein H257_09646 [Aphanomyces astaci]|uniref:DDE Tnp4 domain-containing protein n=1 Tax=Aphanomyces astaci TaxID=112090 RepID=W4G8V1_APHAT|nr:hypothetical protein H257_09646 [Aphanomyces astaci]ETV76112.1 hypothetical protein H257_09646 [Aphanomyces astaci]|eukprot:XP_009834237.1 hypothetical protein H257_09646 [Aphanomyces astaci]
MRWNDRLMQLSNQLMDSSDEEIDVIISTAAQKAVRQAASVDSRSWSGSRRGRQPNIDRNRTGGHQQIVDDYFGENGKPSTYTEGQFRRRFRLSPLQKCTASIRMLAYGVCADSTDEYCPLGESTTIESMKRFTRAVVSEFGPVYLREPNEEDVEKHLNLNESRGFPGMLGSIDCTHWKWKNCPVAWQGQYQDRNGKRCMILEAVATQDLWIWHAFLGVPGSNNNINVLDRSTLMVKLAKLATSSEGFSVNGISFDVFYLLADGIYPSHSTFQKSLSSPSTKKEKYYCERHESVRKDVERCFGVLFGRFHILANPSQLWSRGHMRVVWLACICLHNMIIDDDNTMEHHPNASEWDNDLERRRPQQPLSFDGYLHQRSTMVDSDTHDLLRQSIIEHLWTERGNM